MPNNGFLPTKDSLLLGWSLNFMTRITAWREELGLTSTHVTDYTELHNGFATTYTAASEPMTRTRAAVAEKNVARRRLKEMASLLARLISGQSNVSDSQRIDLGLTVRKAPSPIGVPTEAPLVEIGRRLGTMVEVHVHAATGESRRSKPPGVYGAGIYTYVGPEAPTDPSLYQFQGNTTRTTTEVTFDPALPAGTVVWIVANWFNPRNQTGPGSAAVSTVLAGGSTALTA